MKTMFIKQSKSVLFLFLLSLVCNTVAAQDIATILFGENSKTDYIGQYNYNGKRKNGFGIERLKDGAVYVGDFSENKISGRGMLIALEKGIENVEGASVYVGKWYNGKKEGKGSCYSSTGTLVYEGNFEKDKPVGEWAGQGASSLRRFCISEQGKDLYLGEMNGDTPNGFGLMVCDDGQILYGMMKNGVRQGIGMVCYNEDMWEVGKWTDGEFKSFNNSKISQANLEAFKKDCKEFRKEMRGMLLETTFNLAQVGLDIAASVKGNNSQGTAGTGDAGGGASVASGKSQSYYQTLYNKWEQKAKNTFEDRVRHKVSAETYGDGRVASSDAKLLRQYQSSMRSVRMAAKKEGFNIPQSKYENVSF